MEAVLTECENTGWIKQIALSNNITKHIAIKNALNMTLGDRIHDDSGFVDDMPEELYIDKKELERIKKEAENNSKISYGIGYGYGIGVK